MDASDFKRLDLISCYLRKGVLPMTKRSGVHNPCLSDRIDPNPFVYVAGEADQGLVLLDEASYRTTADMPADAYQVVLGPPGRLMRDQHHGHPARKSRDRVSKSLCELGLGRLVGCPARTGKGPANAQEACSAENFASAMDTQFLAFEMVGDFGVIAVSRDGKKARRPLENWLYDASRVLLPAEMRDVAEEQHNVGIFDPVENSRDL